MSKTCKRCNLTKSDDMFYKQRGILRPYCKSCWAKYTTEYKHEKWGTIPYNKAVGSAVYLGVYVAETVLQNAFDHAVRMPYGNPGYDFVCKNGYKIDVKSSRLHARTKRLSRWEFTINHNNIADYFLLIGFNDDINNLEPKKLWLIPNNEIVKYKNLCITEDSHKWDTYARPVKDAVYCCEHMKSENGE